MIAAYMSPIEYSGMSEICHMNERAIGEGETEISVLVVHMIRRGIQAEYPVRIPEEGEGQKPTLLFPLQGCCY